MLTWRFLDSDAILRPFVWEKKMETAALKEEWRWPYEQLHQHDIAKGFEAYVTEAVGSCNGVVAMLTQLLLAVFFSVLCRFVGMEN